MAETLAPSDPPTAEHTLLNIAAADPGSLACRLAVLKGGANVPLGAATERLAPQLASIGAKRLRGL